jgi:hypothetical protein
MAVAKGHADQRNPKYPATNRTTTMTPTMVKMFIFPLRHAGFELRLTKLTGNCPEAAASETTHPAGAK